MTGFEPAASCSQSRRATNCATPGYEIFQLWSNMWSRSFFDQLQARGKVLSGLLSQGFPGFPRAETRTRVSRSQSRRATNCATPGYGIVLSVVFHVVLAVFWPTALRNWFPLLVVSQRVVGLGFFPHGWARYAPKAGALPTAQHPDMKLWDCPGVSSKSSAMPPSLHPDMWSTCITGIIIIYAAKDCKYPIKYVMMLL